MIWESLAAAAIIALLRTFDVSLGTVRISFVVQGRRGLAAIVGFVEATTVVVAAAIVFADLGDPFRIVGFGVGFAVGQYIGITATGWLRIGTATARIFSSGDPIGVADSLREAGFSVTTFDGEGRDGPVRMVHAVVQKRRLKDLLRICERWRDECFVTVGDNPIVNRSYPGATALRMDFPTLEPQGQSWRKASPDSEGGAPRERTPAADGDAE